MKAIMSRIPFGAETKMEIMAARCPGCDAHRGQYHQYGCQLESCPLCGARLRQCTCMVLSIVDGFKLTGAIAKSLTRNEALNILDTDEAVNSTYERQGAFNWTCLNAPPGYREGYRESYMEEMERRALEIIGGVRHGDLIRVPLDKAAECLGLSVEEARPIMDELQAECLYPGWDEKTGLEQ